MMVKKISRTLLSVVCFGASVLASDAQAFRSEYDAYESCRTAIKRTLDQRKRLAFEPYYASAVDKRDGAWEFFINFKIEDSEKNPYRAHCRSEGFGSVEALQVQAGHWDLESTNR